MTLRARLALAAGAAVAIAVVAASLASYFGMRHELRAQVDRTLTNRSGGFDRYPGMGHGPFRVPQPAFGGACVQCGHSALAFGIHA